MNRSFAALACSVAAALLGAAPAAALEPIKTESIVYRTQSFDGAEHRQTAVTPNADDIHFLADVPNLVDPRHTLTYFWPLKREYNVDWSGLDIPASGTLEVLDGKRVVQRLERTDAVVVYPEGTTGGSTYVVTGDNARRVKADYEREAASANRLAMEASRAEAAYQDALRAFVRDSSAGRPATLPTRPNAPKPSSRRFVGDLLKAYVVNLPAGHYAIRLIDEGRVVEGTERGVTAFQPIRTSVASWQLVPEERWTRRIPVDGTGQRLFAAAGSRFYLMPFEAGVFDARRIAALRDPQAAEPAAAAEWVHRKPIANGTLVIEDGAAPVVEIPRQDFTARQTSPEGALGYAIEPWNPDSSRPPDLSAFAIAIPAEAAGHTYRIALRDQDGRLVPGSERTLKIVDEAGTLPLWLLAAFPLLVGLGAFGRYRLTTRRALPSPIPL